MFFEQIHALLYLNLGYYFHYRREERRVQVNERQMQTSAGEWRHSSSNERPVAPSKDKSKTNERRVQMREDKWETGAILSFTNPESPTVFTSKRTGKLEIKPCVEDFVLWVLIYTFLIHSNAQCIEHDNDVTLMLNLTAN